MVKIFKPLEKIYDAYDNTLMYFANKSVNLWNFTTGNTKTSLSNCLVLTAPLFEISGFIMTNPIIGAMMSPVYLFNSYTTYYRNLNQEAEEESVRDKDININPYYHKANEQLGTIWSLIAGIESMTCSSSLETGSNDYGLMVAAGNGMRGLSHYIMRADSPLPRKNCISRGIDRLEKLVLKKQLSPEAVRIR